ncbi:MAG: hypothetical protein KF766_08780 [Rhodocyclaceae bacterium]|nr:hypothetical protein [Rhodocyclaceae bacterium]
MAKFSQRLGYSPTEAAFQREAVDAPLRTKLWNILKVAIWDDYAPYEYRLKEKSQRIDHLVRRLWFNFLNRDLDKLPEFRRDHGENAYGALKRYFFECQWFEVYDFLEEIAEDQGALLPVKVREWINQELEVHNSAYRFVSEQISEITSKTEIVAIEEGLADADAPAREHLESALRMLSDREAPDYRNAVKESISAVEAACRNICGMPSATLGDALKKVREVHPAFSKAFSALYGYTSDASGVRHALTDEATVTYADAKFMLVACSAFVSYLKSSASNI